MKKLIFLPALLLTFLSFDWGHSCTIFMAAKAGKVLAGNNEDFIDPNTSMWFLPPEPGKYGRVYFGFGVGLPQGGMNDQGLFFDFAALPPSPENPPSSKSLFPGNLAERAMEQCSTVEEVIHLFETYDRRYMATHQAMFGDRNGDSVIIEAGKIIRKNEDYQICTNFRQSENKEKPYSIERYNIVDQMLKETEDISVELFRSILARAHQEPVRKGGSATMYSNVYDLRHGVIYLYHFHNYADVVEINLAQELQKGEHSVRISSLFSPSLFAYDQFAKANRIEERVEVSTDPSVFEEFIGNYQFVPLPSMSLTVTRVDDALLCRLSGFRGYQIYPEAENKYFFKVMNAQVEFVRDESGQVNSLVFTMYDNKIPANRVLSR